MSDLIDEIRARLAAATPSDPEASAPLYEHAPDDLAFLLAEVERLGGGQVGDVVHRDYRGDPDPRPLAERAAASDAVPSDKDDAIALVVERLRLMHRKILNAPLNGATVGSLPETDGPEAPAGWPSWRTMVAWSPVLFDYAVLVEHRLISLERMRVERDAAVERAREVFFKPGAAERAFDRRVAILGPRLTTALNEALAVLAEPAPDHSKPPSGVPVGLPGDRCQNCRLPRHAHPGGRVKANRANHPEDCKCLLCEDFITVACSTFKGPGVPKPSYGADVAYRPDDAKDWLEGVAAEIDSVVQALAAVAPVDGKGPDGDAEDDYTLGVRNRLRVLAARVRS